MNDSQRAFEQLASRAVACRYCFEAFEINSALIDVAQPRFVGANYWNEIPRIAIVCLNPGAGKGRLDGANEQFREYLHRFRDGTGPFSAVMEHQEQDMPSWGRGRFERFYFSGLGLLKRNVAFANVAWCATAGDRYPSAMLSTCFKRFTEPLMNLLTPQIIILSGSGTHRFAAPLLSSPAAPRIITMLHYAHREGADAERDELARVRKVLSEVRDGVV